MPKSSFDVRTRGIPEFKEVKAILEDEDAAIEMLKSRGTFDFNLGTCKHCSNGQMVELKGDKTKGMLRCSNSKCRKKLSMFNRTFFTRCTTPINEIMMVAYLWLLRAPWNCILSFTGLSENTVTNWIGFLREMVAMDVDTEDIMIGGEGIEVEIDETKFGKRKYNRGHRLYILYLS
jgi:hypothetical protein